MCTAIFAAYRAIRILELSRYVREMPITLKVIQISERQIHHLDQGNNGPPLVFVHDIIREIKDLGSDGMSKLQKCYSNLMKIIFNSPVSI
ncbi:MAG TPA: hypothetical protein VKA09_15015 [Nitrososphaeraceae archaeon]|nr:hypothetical protein [Nitrososphaeraceae archaeon]